jgi:hypothetical protein
VREAPEKLEGIESYYPGASWLPLVVSNPAEKPISWKPITDEIKMNQRKVVFKNVVVASIVTCVTSYKKNNRQQPTRAVKVTNELK